MTEVMTSEALLREASSLLSATDQERRQVLLHVGELLHDYILARLREGQGLPEARRVKREGCVRDAASALNMKTTRVHDLMHVAMAARLLFTDLDLGTLAWSVVRLFKTQVQRRKITRERTARSRYTNPGKADPSEREVWYVVSGTPHPARRAMTRIVSEGYNWAQSMAYLKTLTPQDGPKNERGEPVSQRRAENYHHANKERRALPTPEIKKHVAFAATPRDLAETVAGMILGNADPTAVLEQLLAVEGFARLLKTVRV